MPSRSQRALPITTPNLRGVFAVDDPQLGMLYFARARDGRILERARVRQYETLDEVLCYLGDLVDLMDPEAAPRVVLTVSAGGGLHSPSAPSSPSRPVRLVP